jgi:hypothetical protein
MTTATDERKVPAPWWKRRLKMSLDGDPLKYIEYVPGGTPYFWIGDRNGNYYASINGEDLLDFVRRAYREEA